MPRAIVHFFRARCTGRPRALLPQKTVKNNSREILQPKVAGARILHRGTASAGGSEAAAVYNKRVGCQYVIAPAFITRGMLLSTLLWFDAAGRGG